MLKKLIIPVIFILIITNISFAQNSNAPQLTLSAQAILRKPSDELQLKIGVVTLGETAESTLTENNSKMQAVIANLEAAGLNQDEYETGHFSIQPTYTPYPKDPPYNWKPTINGYEVNNSIIIHTEKLDRAGKIIDVANKAGANSISDIRFGLHNPRLYWTEALSAAASNAIQDARAIAAVTGVRLVRVLSIRLDNAHVASPHVNTAYLTKASGADSVPIEPGEVTITANVTLIYEIASE